MKNSLNSSANVKLVLLLAISSVLPYAARSQELPDLSSFGFPYTLDASEGWHFITPEGNPDADSDYFEDFTTVESCAQKCSNEAALAGVWDSGVNGCYCFYDLTSACLEPCYSVTGIDFSTQPYNSSLLCDKSYCDDEYYYDGPDGFCANFDAAACDATLAILRAEEPDFSAYGYTHLLNAIDGWLLQPPGANQTFSQYDGVVSAASCARKCEAENAPAGAWNSQYSICWCYFDLETHCLEPCVEETGFDFSTQPFLTDQYCEKSFCDEDYYHTESRDYCDGLDFDAVVCDAKIAARNAPKDLEFAALGYPYVQNLTEGFYFQPPPSGDDFLLYDFFIQETSCVQKCQEENAPAGAWNSRTNSCWCYFAMDTQCLEPCIEETGFVFNSEPFSASSDCEKSLCDVDYYYNELKDYCDNDVQFDVAACDAKRSAKAMPTGPTPPPSSSAFGGMGHRLSGLLLVLASHWIVF